jgi:hypothetical protein
MSETKIDYQSAPVGVGASPARRKVRGVCLRISWLCAVLPFVLMMLMTEHRALVCAITSPIGACLAIAGFGGRATEVVAGALSLLINGAFTAFFVWAFFSGSAH